MVSPFPAYVYRALLADKGLRDVAVAGHVAELIGGVTKNGSVLELKAASEVVVDVADLGTRHAGAMAGNANGGACP